MPYRRFSHRSVSSRASCLRWPGAMVAALLVAACGQQGAQQSEAPVEVLTGSISDAMLPVDQLTSQPPLDPRAVRAGAAGKPVAAEDATGAAEPAATPTAGVTPAAKPAAGDKAGDGAA